MFVNLNLLLNNFCINKSKFRQKSCNFMTETRFLICLDPFSLAIHLILSGQVYVCLWIWTNYTQVEFINSVKWKVLDYFMTQASHLQEVVYIKSLMSPYQSGIQHLINFQFSKWIIKVVSVFRYLNSINWPKNMRQDFSAHKTQK